MKRPPIKPITPKETRRFMFRVLLLLTLIGLVAWAGWFAPWNRADTRVTVEAVDAPRLP